MTRLAGAKSGAGTEPSSATALSDAPPPAGRGLTTRLVLGGPDLLVSAVAGSALGPMILLLAGQFRTWTVVPAGLLGAAVAVRVCGLPDEMPDESPRRVRREVLWSIAAGVLVLAWVLVNLRYTAENVYATRDPATYNVTARWLMDQPSLHIPTHLDVFGSPARAVAEGAGFSDDGPGELYSQGNHLMPAMAAVVGWGFGIEGMFRVNVLLGAIALVALFGLARRMVGAPLATLVTATMAVTMPMVYVSRDMYSEPLMMLFLMGGVGLLHRAARTARTRDYALSGLVFGCSAMVRIDAYAALLAVIISATLVVGLAGPRERRAAVRHGLALLTAGAVPTFIGWLDVSRLSAGYYRDQHHNIMLELSAATLLLLAGPVVAFVLWRDGLRGWLAADRVRTRLGVGAAAVLVLTFLFLLSRPLWLSGRYPLDNNVLKTWQAVAGVTVDGGLSYNERTVVWMMQYLGWTTVVLALVGYCLLLTRTARRRDHGLIGMLTLGLTMSVLYLWDAQITPDQPWAMRRYVPVVLPLLLVAAAVALQWLAGLGPRRLRIAGRPLGLVVAVVLGAVMLVEPYRVTTPMRHVREQVPMYSQTRALCDAIGERGAVVSVDREALAGYAMTMRAYCGVPSVGVEGAGRDELRSMAAAARAHGRTLYVLSRDRAAMSYTVGGVVRPFDVVQAQLWPNDINRTPRRPGLRTTEVYLGRVADDGAVEVLTAR